VDYSGAAFGSPQTPTTQPFGYNGRNELTSSTRDTMSWTYTYDPIGNRTEDVTNTTGTARTTQYEVSPLNQYLVQSRPLEGLPKRHIGHRISS